MTVAMDKYPLLAEIASPADLRRLPVGKLPELAAELRDFLIHSVSTRGGHFAAMEQPKLFVNDVRAFARSQC